MTYGQVDKVITKHLKKSCSAKVFEQLIFLCPELYSVDWRGGEMYVAPKKSKQLSLPDMNQRKEVFLQSQGGHGRR